MQVIDRKQAADMLNVSIRTVDRYIQKGELEKEEVNGRIFIRTVGLKKLLEKKKLQERYLAEIETLSPPPEKSESFDRSPSSERDAAIEANYTDEGSGYYGGGAPEDGNIYKKLYEESQEELKLKQERLEGANYRVGQLEGLLKETVPLLEYKKALAEQERQREELEDLLKTFEKDNELLSQTVESKSTELVQIGERLKGERFNKKIFIIILIILFLLQPLWLIFPA